MHQYSSIPYIASYFLLIAKWW